MADQKNKKRVADFTVQINQVIKAVEKDHESEPFSVPVDWKGLGLTDYPKIIKNPMDLSKVKKNLKASKYTFVKDFIDDMTLIWTNCKTFNQPESNIYIAADHLEKLCQTLYTRFNLVDEAGGKKGGGDKKSSETSNPKKRKAADRSDDTSGDSGSSEVTYEEKHAFVQRVKQLDADSLGKLIRLVQKEKPEAVNELSSVDLEVDVDACPRSVFDLMDRFVQTCVEKKRRTK